MSAYATINEAYGKDFNKKKKKEKKGKKQSACHYYAQRYSKSQNQKDAEPFNLSGLDSNDVFSKYDKNSPDKAYDLYSNRQDFIKANKDNIRNCDIKEEEDYFEKLYDKHDFKPMMSRDGDNLMKVEPTEYEDVKFDNRINREIRTAVNLDLNYETDDDETDSIGTSLEMPEINDNEINNNKKLGTSIQNKLGTSIQNKVGTSIQNKVGTSVNLDTGSSIKEPKYESDKNYMDLGLYLISGILLIFILEQFVQIGIMMRETRSGGGNLDGGANNNPNYMNKYNYPPPAMYHPSIYPQQMYNSHMYNNLYKNQ